MPQTAIGAFVGKLLAAGGAKAFFVKVVANVLLTVAVSKLFGPKIPKGALSGHSVMTRSALEYRKIVYGQAICSGPVVYNNVSGASNEYLWYLIALADHECEDVISVWFDGDEIPKADIDWAAGTGASDGTGTGAVSTTKWVGENSTNAVHLWYYLGYAGQPAAAALTGAFTDWTSSHRLRGVSNVIARLLYNEDTEGIWAKGPPSDIKVVLKGRKLYDPRLDSTRIIDESTSPITYGSGSHRWTDTTTWEWSDNPALCVADYLTEIKQVLTTSVDWPSIASSADDCEVQVVVPPVASPMNTENRFACNGVLSMGESHRDNLIAIASAMDGKIAYSSGKWKVRSSVWEAPSFTIDADDLAGPLEIRGSAPTDERFNLVRGFFVDPSRLYESVEFPHVTDTDYVTRDGGRELPYDLQLPMTNTETMAQRIAYRNLEQSNNQIIVQLTMNKRGAQIEVGQVVSLDFDWLGWTADDDILLLQDGDAVLLQDGANSALIGGSEKTFRCINWQRGSDGSFVITLKEDRELAYSDPQIQDYGSGASTGVTFPGEALPAPSGLTATSVPAGVRLDWTNPPANTFTYIVVYESTSSTWYEATSPQGSNTAIAYTRASTLSIPHDPGETYYYWIRALRVPNVFSTRDPDSDTSNVSATSGTVSGSNDPVTLQGDNLTDIGTGGTDGEVSYRLTSTGKEQSYEGSGGSYSDIGDWLISGSPGDYEARLTVDSGDSPTGSSLATWLDLSSTLTWTLTQSSNGNSSNNCTIEIRNATTETVIATRSVNMNVTKEP